MPREGMKLKAGRSTYNAIYDEQPPPTAETVAAVQASMNARLNEATDHRPRQTRRREDTGTLPQLTLSIPRAQDIMRAHKSSGFDDSLKEADSQCTTVGTRTSSEAGCGR